LSRKGKDSSHLPHTWHAGLDHPRFVEELMRRQILLFAVCVLPLAAFAGCEQSQPQVASTEPPAVPVSKPVVREVTEFVDFTGRTDAVQAVDVRARVTGFLVDIPFKEGAEVKKGDLLFEIDPRPYHAQLDQAESQVELNDASLKLARTTLARDQTISKSVPGGVSQQQLDQDLAAVEEAEARLKASRASTKVYRLNVDFTKVVSPIDGQVSRYYYTLGNLVNQDQTLLTTVVSLDTMYAYFDMDEPTLLRIRSGINRALTQGAVRPPTKEETSVLIGMPVLMGLQGEEGYPHKGKINFVNNQVNPTTGSISVRGIFENPRPPGGARMLSPGMYARIRLPIGEPHSAVLVIDRAISSDQGLKFVYVVGADNKVEYRRVTTGSQQEDGLRVILDGLNADEEIVVGGLQQVKPRMEIRPDEVPMPSLALDDAAGSASTKSKSGKKGGKQKPAAKAGAEQ
jgi:membrane fusion protein, multidrug efflux system